MSAGVVVDLTGVEYLDSGAINVMFTHAEHLHVITRPVLLSALPISGLTTVATVESRDASPELAATTYSSDADPATSPG